MNYAVFIITYERAEILKNTIDSFLNQSLPPQSILIVDNSESSTTKELINSLNNPIINYFAVGYNSGPSGGAFFGLQKMLDTKSDWFFWGDDDDPPASNSLIEKIFGIVPFIDEETCGQIGLVGSRFNKSIGEISRISDQELKEKKIIEVDTIGGGQCKIISRKIVEKGILPEKKLFFGFEELDLDIKIKKAGFKSYVSGNLLYKSRKKSGRLNFKIERSVLTDDVSISRQYYSVRNLLTIFFNQKYYSALLYLIIKKNISVILAFKEGFKKGVKYATIIYLAHYHFLIGKYGKINLKLKQ